MKIKSSLLAALLLIACNKETQLNAVSSSGQDNAKTTPVQPPDAIPLNDLGTGMFHDSVAGLYPGGANEPSGIYAEDLLATCKATVPLDVNGNPSPQGYIIFISMGGSTGGKNMTALINKTKGNPLTNPRLKMWNANQPAQQAPLSAIGDPRSLYWVHVNQSVSGHKSSNKQVQVVYLETDDSSPNLKFPDRPNYIKNEIEDGIRTMKQQFPNLKLVYILGRTRTFPNTTTPWNSEPSPYFFGWSCKWAIQDQINGVPGMEYKGPNKVAPMLAWGFYQWADSLPRKTDNFYWRYSETKDGLHANDAGQDTLSSRFQKFLLTDPYASKWYAKP